MPKTKPTKQRTGQRKAASGSKLDNFDGVFLFKMVLYLLIGSMWLKISHGETLHIPIPIGLIVGLTFAMHEHFRIDRKIEYAVMLVAMLFGYFAPFGLYISF